MKLAILGAGSMGYVAAIKAAHLDSQVTIIDNGEVGGTCLNWGCIPTKSFVASTELLAKTRRLEEFVPPYPLRGSDGSSRRCSW